MPGILYPGGSTPIPLCPSRRIQACPERVRMRLPSSTRVVPAGGVVNHGGFVSSPARKATSSQKNVVAFRDLSEIGLRVEAPIARAPSALTAFTFEFVAKPEQAASAPLLLPAAIQSGLEDIAGFAGSLVMVSDQEARLITVIIFWSGPDSRRSCERSVRRVRTLLVPYLDRCLRMQNLQAHMPRLQVPMTEIDAEIETEIQMEPASAARHLEEDACFINDEPISQEANVCVA